MSYFCSRKIANDEGENKKEMLSVMCRYLKKMIASYISLVIDLRSVFFLMHNSSQKV